MKLTTNILNLKMNFVHLIVASSIYVKKVSLDQVSFTKAFIMYLITTKTAINLPHMMIHYMMDTAKHFMFFFPYGITFTWVFRYFKVYLTDEVLKTHKETYVYSIGVYEDGILLGLEYSGLYLNG